MTEAKDLEIGKHTILVSDVHWCPCASKMMAIYGSKAPTFNTDYRSEGASEHPSGEVILASACLIIVGFRGEGGVSALCAFELCSTFPGMFMIPRQIAPCTTPLCYDLMTVNKAPELHFTFMLSVAIQSMQGRDVWTVNMCYCSMIFKTVSSFDEWILWLFAGLGCTASGFCIWAFILQGCLSQVLYFKSGQIASLTDAKN